MKEKMKKGDFTKFFENHPQVSNENITSLNSIPMKTSKTGTFIIKYSGGIVKNERQASWLIVSVMLIIAATIVILFLRDQNILFIKHNTKFYIDPKVLEDYKHAQPF